MENIPDDQPVYEIRGMDVLNDPQSPALHLRLLIQNTDAVVPSETELYLLFSNKASTKEFLVRILNELP